MSKILEKDWKKARSMKNGTLDLACQRILDSVSKIISDKEKSAHARYLELWKILEMEDDNISLMFNNMKRSSAIIQLARWKFNDLISERDLESFSPDTHKAINTLIESWR
ncbi:MAG: hypothetical protein BA864_13395 [Desulfuromonadales bacterium C00003093]|nr:MAG: hypothetical protein BA864_13395 [Desulfuromonadales bacterium C00003093]